MANDPTTSDIPSEAVAQPSPTPSAPAKTKSAAAPAPTAPPPDGDVALDVWCGEKSRSMGKRVEALSAFYRLAQRKGIGRATPEQFETDFQAFLKTPV